MPAWPPILPCARFSFCFRQPYPALGNGWCPGWPQATPKGPQGLDTRRSQRTLSRPEAKTPALADHPAPSGTPPPSAAASPIPLLSAHPGPRPPAQPPTGPAGEPQMTEPSERAPPGVLPHPSRLPRPHPRPRRTPQPPRTRHPACGGPQLSDGVSGEINKGNQIKRGLERTVQGCGQPRPEKPG